jgi:hypothetical protein
MRGPGSATAAGNLAPPSPSWGGTEGGVAPRTSEPVTPPPLTPPHKGEGDQSVSLASSGAD